MGGGRSVKKVSRFEPSPRSRTVIKNKSFVFKGSSVEICRAFFSICTSPDRVDPFLCASSSSPFLILSGDWHAVQRKGRVEPPVFASSFLLSPIFEQATSLCIHSVARLTIHGNHSFQMGCLATHFMLLDLEDKDSKIHTKHTTLPHVIKTHFFFLTLSHSLPKPIYRIASAVIGGFQRRPYFFLHLQLQFSFALFVCFRIDSYFVLSGRSVLCCKPKHPRHFLPPR